MIETDNGPDAAEIISAQLAPPAVHEPGTLPFTQAPARSITKIVVAIHGIGQQHRSETIRSVARRFGDSCKPAIPLLPLGYFNIAGGSDVRWSQLETDDQDLSAIGFAEVFWADIPIELVRSNDTLEETKAWVRTVVSRAEYLYNRDVKKPDKNAAHPADAGSGHDTAVGEKPAVGMAAKGIDKASIGRVGPQVKQLDECDFRQGIDAVETLAEGVAVIERLCQLATKVGAPKFEVGALLRDFVGDVQTVTEFPQYRNMILYRFHAALNAIVTTFRARYGNDPEIYLVAHSEGTVISMLALLQALSSMELPDPEGKGKIEDGAWVEHLHGFMTLGSPIDKHIALWPELWKEFSFVKSAKVDGQVKICSSRKDAKPVMLRQRIKWRNYFDYGDPVGFRLDEAQRWLTSKQCGAFEFEQFKHDHGYSRYWLPGKAHVDYWNDAELFRHFIDNVVKTPRIDAPPLAPPPANKPLRGFVATCIPYVIAFLLHWAAVVALLAAFSGKPMKELTQFSGFIGQAFAPAILLAAVTVAARLPRLVRRGPRWLLPALVSWGIGALVTWFVLPAGLAAGIGKAYENLAGTVPVSLTLADAGKLTLCAAAFIAALGAWLVPRAYAPKGRRLLVTSGFLLSFVIVLLGPGESGHVNLTELLACLPFVFLWWLGIILFDLAFVWHRYIRNAVCVRTLRAWHNRKDVEADPLLGLGTGKDQKPDPIQARL